MKSTASVMYLGYEIRVALEAINQADSVLFSVIWSTSSTSSAQPTTSRKIASDPLFAVHSLRLQCGAIARFPNEHFAKSGLQIWLGSFAPDTRRLFVDVAKDCDGSTENAAKFQRTSVLSAVGDDVDSVLGRGVADAILIRPG